MSNMQEEGIKRWTSKRKSALVLDIIQGKTTVAGTSRQFDLPPAEIENWVGQAKAGPDRVGAFVRLPDCGGIAHYEQEHSTAYFAAQGLAGAQVGDWPQTACPVLAIGCDQT